MDDMSSRRFLNAGRAFLRGCAVPACLFLGTRFLQGQSAVVTVENPLDISRTSETVEIRLSALDSSLTGGHLENLAVYQDDKRLMRQIVDSDGDGNPDLLLYQADFAPKQARSFLLRSAATQIAPESKVDARFELPRQDLAWENDRIAFRAYGSVLAGDVNNGIDVWTKRVRHLVVNKWYVLSEQSPPGHDYYHEDHGEGGDFFSVGTSLGAGGCALVAGDSLLQPGLFTSHRILATGPIRALFELTYDSGRIGNRSYRVVERISLDAGSNLNRIDVVYSGFPADTQLVVAAGLVERKGVEKSIGKDHGWISLWGPTNEHAENGSLGTAVIMPGKEVRGAKEDARHLLIFGGARAGKPLRYYTGAGWTRSGDFASEAAWNAYVNAFSRRIRAPLILRIERGK